MTRVAVTGGSGKLGRAVVADLSANGYDVITIDRERPTTHAPGEFVRVDLTDFGQVIEALTGLDEHDPVDAVVHLAAVPAPGLLPNAATFLSNVPSTYNVFAAARLAGITNLVWASSETLLGLPFDTSPPYIPVDEEYAVRPETTYSLGKAVEEEMARHFTRWNPALKMIGLRFSNVMEPEDYISFPAFNDDPELRKWNLWGYIDARDAAQAVRLALASDITGFEAFIIAAADTVMSTPSAQLAAQVFPSVELRQTLNGVQTLLSIEKARRLLGFIPAHSWRD